MAVLSVLRLEDLDHSNSNDRRCVVSYAALGKPYWIICLFQQAQVPLCHHTTRLIASLHSRIYLDIGIATITASGDLPSRWLFEETIDGIDNIRIAYLLMRTQPYAIGMQGTLKFGRSFYLGSDAIQQS